MYFQLKTNSVGITEVSVDPMVNNMYFLQWIIISYNKKIATNYIEIFLCTSKLLVFNLVLIFKELQGPLPAYELGTLDELYL